MSQRRQRSRDRENEATGLSPRRVAAGAGLALGASFAVAGPAQAADFTVTNLDADDPGSLRDAIDQANATAGPDRVLFQAGLTGTIDLNGGTDGYTGEIYIEDSLEIVGPGAGQLAVSGNARSRIFYIDGPEGTIDVTIAGLQLRQGRAKYGGGAPFGGDILSGDANLTVVDSVVRTGAAFVAGGIFSAGDLTVRDSTISGNQAALVGGGIAFGGYTEDPEALITGSTISNNSAANQIPFFAFPAARQSSDQKYGGGGVAAIDGTVTVARSTIANNSTAGQGGGVLLGNDRGGFEGDASFLAATISGNAAGAGGGIYSYVYSEAPRRAEGDPTLSNTIVAGNEADGAQFGHDLGGGPFNAAFSLIGSAEGTTIDATTAGSNLFGVDPLLGALANNGGPTRTMKLNPGSPALDAGRTPAEQTTDQRGRERPVDLPGADNAAGGDAADIGAYERQSRPPEPVPEPTGSCQGVDATLSGDGERNFLRGTPGRDVIRAGGGNDVIRGLGGNDLICAGAGIDVATGGGGRDRIFGQAGNDRLFGQNGRDFGQGGTGQDLLVGGDQGDNLRGGDNKDRLLGANGNDKLYGQAANDVILGAKGNDLIRGGPGEDRLSGGTGINDVQQ